jgi:2,3-bisphosphoglycerate-independent phosphoglycerate mutase
MIDVPKPMVLMILDGYGIRDNGEGNAPEEADTPVLDELFRNRPWSQLKASGEAVGLPAGQIGNSEVGHMNLGAGRVVYQPLVRINQAIEDGDFYENDVLVDAVEYADEHDGTLHLIGLLSDGGVHSHQDHVRGLLELADRHGHDDVAVHAQLDGRDVPPRSAKPYLERLEEDFEDVGVGRLATMGGRYFGMDRDERWDRTEKSYNAIVRGEAEVVERDSVGALERAYEERDENDEFVTPTVFVDEDDQPRATVEDGDSVIFFNFRPDRARQMTRAFTEKDFEPFPVEELDIHFACMTQYDEKYELPVAFPPLDLKNVLSEYLSDQELKQYHTAETEKYAHVTFFFNGGREDPFPGEERELVPSPKVETYDQQPEMSAPEVTDKLVARLREHDDDFIVVNYANPDMVGHTGDLDAAVQAMEALDECIGRVLEVLDEVGGELVLTSDHGNVETMIDPETGDNHTAHTTVECPLLYRGSRDLDLTDGTLADVAPTILALLGLPQPEEMTGQSLARLKESSVEE